MKKLLVIAIAAFAFTACNSSSKTEGENHGDTTATEQPAAPAEGATTTPAEATPATTPAEKH